MIDEGRKEAVPKVAGKAAPPGDIMTVKITGYKDRVVGGNGGEKVMETCKVKGRVRKSISRNDEELSLGGMNRDGVRFKIVERIVSLDYVGRDGIANTDGCATYSAYLSIVTNDDKPFKREVIGGVEPRFTKKNYVKVMRKIEYLWPALSK